MVWLYAMGSTQLAGALAARSTGDSTPLMVRLPPATHAEGETSDTSERTTPCAPSRKLPAWSDTRLTACAARLEKGRVEAAFDRAETAIEGKNRSPPHHDRGSDAGQHGQRLNRHGWR